MRSSILRLLLAASVVNGHAGMGRILADIKRHEVIQARSTSLLGDLVGLVGVR